jgi:tetratricopeptide (TPR) repeat protein
MTPNPSQLAMQESAGVAPLMEALRRKVEADPEDCSALETLRDALRQLGCREESTEWSYRLAEAYAGRGEFSLALLEYEALLRSEPADSRALEALAGVERRMERGRSGRESIRMDFEGVLDSGVQVESVGDDESGNAELAAFLIRSQIASELAVKKALSDVQRILRKAAGGGRRPAVSLLAEVVRSENLDWDEVLCRILDRTQMSYVPLRDYEVDRHSVRLIPEDLAVGGLMVAFDQMSTTLCVAVGNPFDRVRMERVEAVLGTSVNWYVASPEAVLRVLADVFRLPSREGGEP